MTGFLRNDDDVFGGGRGSFFPAHCGTMRSMKFQGGKQSYELSAMEKIRLVRNPLRRDDEGRVYRTGTAEGSRLSLIHIWKLYTAQDPQLTADHQRALRLTRRYNMTAEDQQEEREALLQELLGSVGEDVVKMCIRDRLR